MPNWCNFDVVVTGPKASRDELATLLEGAIAPAVGGESGGQPVLRFDAATWGEMPDEQPWVWVDAVSAGKSHEYIGRSDTAVYFSGTATWSPPLGWMHRASIRFPDLTINSTSNTESEWFEEWTAVAGKVGQREQRLIDIPRDAVVEWARHGRVLIDKRHGLSVPVDLFDLVTACDDGDTHRLMGERLVLLEQFHHASRYSPGAACVGELANKLEENDRLFDEAFAWHRIDDLDPADDAERQRFAEGRMAHRRRQRDARRIASSGG